MTPLIASVSTEPRRVLIRAPNWIGDCVMAMPTVQRLRERFPRAHLALLAADKVIELWHGNPHLDELIPLTRWVAMRGKRFDLAVLLPNSFRSAWEARRAGIPRRVGFAGHWRRWLLTDVVANGEWRRPTTTHLVHHYLALSRHLGGNDELCQPRIWLSAEEQAAAESMLGAPPAGGFCALAPSAEYGPAKRWLAERFVETARQVAGQFDVRWVLVGGPHDVGICRPVAEGLGGAAVNLAGKTTLRQLAAVLARCRLLLTNDSGPMHVSYAVGTPVVAIFGSTEPSATGPVGSGHVVIRNKVDCSPCFLRECPTDFRCMRGIEAGEVVARVSEILQRGP